MQGVLTSLMLGSGDVAVPVNNSVPVNSWTPTDVIDVKRLFQRNGKRLK